MNVLGTVISEQQIAAGNAAMVGQFRLSDVVHALTRAGVPHDNYVAGRAADRLLQKARKAGRISAVTNKLWRSTAA